MGDEHNFSLTTFSPSGKLVQIEYALVRVSNGNTSLAIKAKNGVVLATEKKLPALVDQTSVEKISLITNHIGLVYSGMGPDTRVLIKKGRKKAEAYYRIYKDRIPTLQLVKELAAIMQEYTQSGSEKKNIPSFHLNQIKICRGVRPFGVSLLIAGFDEEGPQLYQVDPSGSYFAWKATAIGKNMNNAKTFLEKRF
jgi:20S proteasome subunit alpha 2